MSSRAAALRSMLEQDPKNGFIRYGLAMEFVNSGELELAVTEFRQLLEHDPTYAAAYFHGGQTLEKLGRAGEAAELYREGISVTSRTGDEHTRSELQAALSMIAS